MRARRRSARRVPRAGAVAPLAWTAVLVALSAGAASAQEGRLRVVVEDVAGREFYVDAGTDAGLAVGDTVQAAADSAGAWTGRLLVLSASTLHARLAYAGSPFAVTRGGELWLERPAISAEPAPSELAAAGRRPPAYRAPAVASAAEAGPRVHGRVSFDVDGVRSMTRWGEGAFAQGLERQVVVSATRLRLTMDQLPGGWKARTSFRAAHRADDTDPIVPATVLDVSEAMLERDFQSVPLRLSMGRFYGRFGPSGGVWDGAMARFGREATGFGVAVGFQPASWTRAPSTDMPRTAVFVEHGIRGESLRWNGVAAFHAAWTADPLTDPMFLEVSQTMGGRRARLYQDAVVERSPSGGWQVARFLLEGSTPLSERVVARARYSLQRPHPLLLEDSADAEIERLDGFGGGFSFDDASFGLSVDASANRVTGRDWSGAATVSFRLPRLWMPGIGFATTATWWSNGSDHGLTLRPGFTGGMGAVRLRGGYAMDNTSALGSDLRSDAIEGDLWIPLSSGWALSAHARRQWGGSLEQTSLHAGISTTF